MKCMIIKLIYLLSIYSSIYLFTYLSVHFALIIETIQNHVSFLFLFCLRERERERERKERERHGERQRQRDSKTDRETDRQRKLFTCK